MVSPDLTTRYNNKQHCYQYSDSYSGCCRVWSRWCGTTCAARTTWRPTPCARSATTGSSSRSAHPGSWRRMRAGSETSCARTRPTPGTARCPRRRCTISLWPSTRFRPGSGRNRRCLWRRRRNQSPQKLNDASGCGTHEQYLDLCNSKYMMRYSYRKILSTVYSDGSKSILKNESKTINYNLRFLEKYLTSSINDWHANNFICGFMVPQKCH